MHKFYKSSSPTFVPHLFNEEIKKKDKERNILMSLFKKLGPVRDIKQLEQVLQSEFINVNFFKEAILFLIKPGQSSYIPFHLKYNGKLDMQWTSFQLSEHNDFFSWVKNLTEAAELDIAELLCFQTLSDCISIWNENGIKTITAVPLSNETTMMGTLILLSKNDTGHFSRYFGLINEIACQIATVYSNILINEKVANELNELINFKKQLEAENFQLQEEIQTTHQYSEIIGTGSVMKKVFHLVSQVAATNSSVLLLGETGTGKELIARAIHHTSSRKDKAMIKVNCAAIPANLIESELFGHERGSFTGSIERRIGKFEQANHSTIFLDEIGEMPYDLQVKLLRVLQEKEIERIGGKTTIKIDVRIIAATNRDLYKQVRLGNFRSDLYFRLNVFPITVPSLRERKEDIPLLAKHFVEKYAKTFKISTPQFTSKAMKQLIAYNWPGNVRELEHLIERSTLLAKGNTIQKVYMSDVSSDDNSFPLQNVNIKTIDEVEREHIISVLKMTNGKVSGIGGAAEILKIPATTLSSKMLKLKIKKRIF